jgi:hypothetical protein
MVEHVKASEHSERRYEDSEVSVKKLVFFAAGVVGLVLVGVLGSALAFRFFVRHTPMGPPASPFEDVRQMPPTLRLQTDAPQDLQKYRASQDKILSGYAWVHPQAGVVQIPIDRAMKLLLQKGYPVRGSSPANGQINVPGEQPPPADQQATPTPLDGEETR